MIPDLLNANFDDSQSLSSLFDTNDIQHMRVQQALAQKGVVSGYPMATVPLPDENWMRHHSDEHNFWLSALNLASPGELSSFDLQKQDQFYQWCDIHAQHHDLINAALGLQ
jgi:hypothetical protein